MKVVKIVSKTLRMIMRSKTSLAAVLLGPLLIITLVGLAFGNISQYSLNIGVYAHEYTDLVESYLGAVGNDTTYQITRYPLVDNCLNDIRRGSTHTCIEFPEGFEAGGGNGTNEIKFYVDQSKTDMVEIIRNVVVERLSQRTAQITEEKTDDVLSRVSAVDEVISEQAVVLSDISGELDSTRDHLDEAISGFEYINQLIAGSGDRMDDFADMSGNMLDYAETLKDEAQDAVSIGQNLADSNSSDYSTLEGINDEVDDVYNDTYDVHLDLLNMIRESRDENSDMGSSTSSVERDLDSARDGVDETIDLLTGVTSAFAEASDDFAGIDGAENITAPVRTVVEPVISERAPLSYMFPTLLVMVIMLVSVMLAGTLVVVEKTSSSYFRNFVTPTSDMSFIAGIFFSNIIVTFIQSILIILVASFVFGGVILTNLVTIAVALLIISALFTLLGMLLGYLFNTQEMVSLSGITISSLFIMLSGVIIPLEQMPQYMIDYSVYNPLLMGEGILRRSIIFQTELINEAIMRDVFMIVGFSLLLLFLVVMTQKIKKEVFLNGSHLFRKKKITEDDQSPEDDKSKEKKDRKGLDFLEDYVGTEKEKTKNNIFRKSLASVSSRIAGGFSKITSIFKKAKVDDVIYAGDEEFEAAKGDTSQDYKAMSSSDKNQGDDADSGDDAAGSDEGSKDDGLDGSDDEGKGSGGSSAPSSKNTKRSSGKKPEKKQKSSEKVEKSSKESSVTTSIPDPENTLAKKLEPHQYFVLSSGVILKDFPSLVEELGSMDDDTFDYHVGEDRNDFYLWISNVLKQPKVAEKIRKVNDAKKMHKMLKKFVR